MLGLHGLHAGLSGMADPRGTVFEQPAAGFGRYDLPLGIQSPRERFAGGNPNGGMPVDIEEKPKDLETELMAAETAKLRTEARRMKLSNVLDMFKLVFTAMAATAAVVVALDQIGVIGGA